MIKLILELYKLAGDCIREMRKNTKMTLTPEDQTRFFKAKCCHICKKRFQENEVKVHRP